MGSNAYSLYESLVKENDNWRFTSAKNSDVVIFSNRERVFYRNNQIVNRYPNMCQLGRKDVF